MNTITQQAWPCVNCGVLTNFIVCHHCGNLSQTAPPTPPAPPAPPAPQVSALGVNVTTSVPAPKPDPERVKTRVYIKDGYPDIKCSHEIPQSVTAVISNLIPEYRKKVKKRSYESLQDHIYRYREEVPFQAWADAISQTVLMTLETDATSEINSLVNGGYLALGTTLYKLSAIEQLPQAKALAIARKKAMEKAKAEVELLTATAETAAKGIIAAANRIRTEATILKASVEKEIATIPPKWAVDNGLPLMLKNGRWSIRVQFSFAIEGFDLDFSDRQGNRKRHSWNALPGEARTIHAWVPLNPDGSYTATQIFLDQGSPDLPHMSHGSGCMALPSSAPKKILTRVDARELGYALQFTHRRVQLDSLFTSYFVILKSFKEFFPPDLCNFNPGVDYGEQLNELKRRIMEQAETVTTELEDLETWHA